MKKIINTKNAKIIISCNEATNFFIHTLNIYGVLGKHGKRYALQPNETQLRHADRLAGHNPDYVLRQNKVLSSIDGKIFEYVRQCRDHHGKNWFAAGDMKPQKSLDIFDTGMQYIMDNKLWEKPLDFVNVHMGISAADFNLALQKSWEKFYRDFWRETLGDRKTLFEKCVNSFDYAGALEKMEQAAGRKWSDDFYIFPTEAMAESASWFAPNVNIGSLRDSGGDSDFDFVHEGLHLLLKEEWAKNGKIVKFMNANYKDESYPNWAHKYEQALVIALDHLIRNRDEIDGYCGTEDIFHTAHPLIKEWYNNGCKENLENLMFEIISRTVKR
ncbi:MAG: hypothetical protein FWE64_03920 [Alphaproteobacteria bacterium]|nr:hypothetical protein [Alphaproteobacteria bacterium]